MSDKKSQTKPADGLELVTLIAPHTHGEKECKPGEKIPVTPRQKKFLERHGRIAAPKTDA